MAKNSKPETTGLVAFVPSKLRYKANKMIRLIKNAFGKMVLALLKLTGSFFRKIKAIRAAPKTINSCVARMINDGVSFVTFFHCIIPMKPKLMVITNSKRWLFKSIRNPELSALK